MAVAPYSGIRVREILSGGRPCNSWVVLPDGSKVNLVDCKVVIEPIQESAHLVNLLMEGDRKLDIHQEQDRRRAVLSRLTNPYFSLPGFDKVCRHGPVKGKTCKICDKDKLDALKRLGR